MRITELAKYLGLILDGKLSWLLLREKACVRPGDFYTRKSTIGWNNNEFPLQMLSLLKE